MALQSRTFPTSALSTTLHLGNIDEGGLPAELWLQIFALGKRFDDTSLFASATPENGHIDSVSAISQTCSYFRQLAINSPMLWTSIRIDGQSNISNILQRIARSRPLTLDIAIYLVDENGDPASLNWKRVDTFMDIIIGEMDRWRSLRIRHGMERAGHPVIMRLHDQRALNVEYLSISVNAREPGVTSPAPHILNHGAPRLVSAKLRGVAHTFYRPPLTDLTTLRLEGIGYLSMGFGAFVGAITQPPRLRNLLIRKDIVPADVWALQSHGSIQLLRLRSLHIYSESGVMYAGFLLAMDAPQLSALTLEGVFDPDLNTLWAQATPQKFRNLTSLTLHTEDDISSTTYVKACRLFPNITQYTTRSSRPSNSQLVKALRKPLRNNEEPVLSLWPQLETLRLAPDPSAESMDLIRELLDTRINLGYPLRKLCFFRSDNSGWMSQDEWSASLNTFVRLVDYAEVLPGDASHLDIDDFAM